jgi:pilus assembly protein FimV
MSLKLNRLWLLPALLLASQSWALGLGDIRLSSALNEPLRAEIELLAATPEELDNLKVQLANNETFERYDLDRPLFLSGLEFRIVKSGSADGNVVRITSEDPITEPFITFLVEASWTRGRLLREYTLLLDPPTFAPPPVTQSTQPVTAPTRATQTDSGQIQRPAPQPQAPGPAPVTGPAPTQQADTQPPAQTVQAEPPVPGEPMDEPAPGFDEPSFDSTSGGEIVVQRGETLWGITSRVRPDSRLSMNQTMLAIFEANPQAFAGNINMMSAGATLRIPSADEVFRISRGDALQEVQRQNAAWGGAPGIIDDQTQPALTLLPPDDDVGLFDEDAGEIETDDPVQALIDADEARIDEIEALLSDHQDSLIEISDNELAALRTELAELRGEEPPEPLPVVEDVVEDIGIDDAAEDDIFVDDAIDEDLLADEDLVEDAAPEVEDVAPPVEDTTPAVEDTATPVVDIATPRRQSLIDQILAYVNSIWGIIGGALIIAIALLVWFARRAGSGDEEDSTGMWESLEQDDLDDETMASTERLRALAKEDDAAIVVVEQETAPRAVEDSMIDTFEMPAVDEQPEAIEPIATAVIEDSPVADSPIEDSMIDTFEMPVADESLITEPEPAPEPEPEPEPEIAAIESAVIEEEAPVAEVTPDASLEDTFHSDTAINLDQADPVAEADFHMAYGLYDQAADLINGALDVEPEREDLLSKLCEIYFVWGNRDAFVDAAGRMRTAVGDAPNPEWDKIVIMGQQIASDHEMFSGVSAAAATKAVDLSFEGGEEAGDLDMDLDSDAEQAVDLSLDGGGETAGDLDIDFEASEPAAAEVIDLGADSGDDTAESPTIDTLLDEDTSEMPVAGSSDAPTIEEQFSSLDATGEIPVDDATGEMPVDSDLGSGDATELADVFGGDEPEPSRPADATAEIDLDDLGLDLEGIDESQISDLEETSESQTIDENLTVTGKNLALDDELLGAEDATGTNFEVPEEKSIDDTDVEIDVGLLDATGQTQALTEDMAVDTSSDAGAALSDDEETLLASLASDESTVLAPDVDLDFAKTEALPADTYTGEQLSDETGEMPAIETGTDVDMDDLTGVLEIAQVGETADVDRDAATAEMPHITQTEIDPDDVDISIGDDSPTQVAPPDDAGESDDARTMTEVGTKLDLARAYVDMGDPSGARSILEEVLNEGDEGQRQQAQQLLESMPSS